MAPNMIYRAISGIVHPFVYKVIDWADLLIKQLRPFGKEPETWGYACLCVGRELTALLESEYEAIDTITGDFLHVFCMAPAPFGFMLRRIAEAQRGSDNELTAMLGVLQRHPITKSEFEAQRARLFLDLRTAGLKAPEDTDFLFFGLRATLPVDSREETSSDLYPSVEIDVIAAKCAPTTATTKQSGAFEMFRELGIAAAKCAVEQVSPDEFVRRSTLSWDQKVALSRTFGSFEFIHKVLQALRLQKG